MCKNSGGMDTKILYHKEWLTSYRIQIDHGNFETRTRFVEEEKNSSCN